jgi:hypothetical protein
MPQGSASQHEPSSKMTGSGLTFLTASVLIGMGFGGGGTFPDLAGVAMLVLLYRVSLAGLVVPRTGRFTNLSQLHALMRIGVHPSRAGQGRG